MSDFDNNNSNNSNNQFVISYELLQLFRWILEYEQESLKKIIQKVINSKFKDTINTSSVNYLDYFDSNQELQQNVIDFFMALEMLLYEVINENEINNICHKDLIPAINSIDYRVYNNDILNASVAKAKAACSSKVGKSNVSTKKIAKDIFCKELLKRWKPSKKTTVN